jgi:diketogulonate reductase-like aldo/keto reductase
VSTVPHITLNNGVSMPQLGFGVWQVPDDEAERAVATALEAGYRSIDTAAIYGNEEGTGRAIAASGLSREDVFVTTKLWNSDQGRTRTLAAVDASLDRLGLDYLDLYLIHWPLGDRERLVETWLAMEEILESGKALAIGVCNHEPHHLQWILDAGSIVPAVNQVELHPNLPQWVVRAFGDSHGIVTESWSPLGGSSNSGWGDASKPNTLLTDPVLTSIGEQYGKSAAQVMIRWHLQNGLVVIPKSSHEERIRQNIDVLDFELTGDDIERIATLDTGERVGFHPDANV